MTKKTKRQKKLTRKRRALEEVKMKFIEKSVHTLASQTCSFCVANYNCSKYEKQYQDYCTEWGQHLLIQTVGRWK